MNNQTAIKDIRTIQKQKVDALEKELAKVRTEIWTPELLKLHRRSIWYGKLSEEDEKKYTALREEKESEIKRAKNLRNRIKRERDKMKRMSPRPKPLF